MNDEQRQRVERHNARGEAHFTLALVGVLLTILAMTHTCSGCLGFVMGAK